MNPPPSKLQIDIISDVMCPWCVIGYQQLATALKATGTAHEIRWHPFELNPNMPPEGQNITEHVAEKYGSTKAQSLASRERMTQAGAEVGFEFQYADDMLVSGAQGVENFTRILTQLTAPSPLQERTMHHV